MKNKITIRFIPFKGSTSVLYKGKEPKTKNEIYDFIMSNSLLYHYFPYWFVEQLTTLTEEEILERANDPEEGVIYKSLKEYIIDEHISDDVTFEKAIKQIDSHLRQYDNHIEIE